MLSTLRTSWFRTAALPILLPSCVTPLPRRSHHHRLDRQHSAHVRHYGHYSSSGSGSGNKKSHLHFTDREALDEIMRFSKRRQTNVSLTALMNLSFHSTSATRLHHQHHQQQQQQQQIVGPAAITERTMIQSAKFLHNELQIRCAKMVALLDQAPSGLNLMPSVRRVRDWYMQSFLDLRTFPPVADQTDEQRFTEMLQHVYDRHGSTHASIARGLHELKHELANTVFKMPVEEIDFSHYTEVHRVLNTFYLARIGLRMLIAQHLELHRQRTHPQEDSYIGVICTRTSPQEIVNRAAEDARYMCMRTSMDAPEVIVRCGGTTESSITFPFVPDFLYYIIFELLKNSMLATMEQYNKRVKVEGDIDIPPVEVTIAGSRSNEDISIRISDQGGGIRRSQMPKIWSYLYTTTELGAFDDDDGQTSADFSREGVMAGLGVGLPLSRLYANYFGGDVQLQSMEGHGTDAYIYLNQQSDKTSAQNPSSMFLGASSISSLG